MPVYRSKNKKYWYFIVTINYKQYKRILFNGKYMLSKQEALACENEFINSITLNTKDITLYKLYDEFINSTKSTLKVSSFFTYEKFKRNYLVLLPDKAIKDISISDITKFKNELSKKDVTAQYKNRIQAILKSMLEYGSIAYDLKARLQLPLLEPFKDNQIKDITQKEKWLKRADFNALIKPLEINSYWYVVINMLYNTGLRIGELAALQVKDINEKYISVNKDYIRIKGVDYIQAPKNQNSIRLVPITKTLYNIIYQFIGNKEKETFIFNHKKKYLCQQELRRVLNRLQSDAGLETYKITPHTLRHSYSSNLKALGLNEYEIAKLMGNTPEVASSTYIHSDNNIDEIIKKIEIQKV